MEEKNSTIFSKTSNGSFCIYPDSDISEYREEYKDLCSHYEEFVKWLLDEKKCERNELPDEFPVIEYKYTLKSNGEIQGVVNYCFSESDSTMYIWLYCDIELPEDLRSILEEYAKNVDAAL